MHADQPTCSRPQQGSQCEWWSSAQQGHLDAQAVCDPQVTANPFRSPKKSCCQDREAVLEAAVGQTLTLSIHVRWPQSWHPHHRASVANQCPQNRLRLEPGTWQVPKKGMRTRVWERDVVSVESQRHSPAGAQCWGGQQGAGCSPTPDRGEDKVGRGAWRPQGWQWEGRDAPAWWTLFPSERWRKAVSGIAGGWGDCLEDGPRLGGGLAAWKPEHPCVGSSSGLRGTASHLVGDPSLP